VLIVKIKLLHFDAWDIAQKILSGELPPETDNMEVIEAIAEITKQDGLDTEFWRWDDRGVDRGFGWRKTEYPTDMVVHYAGCFPHWIECRPGPRQPPETWI
jgi:hypothetical protein